MSKRISIIIPVFNEVDNIPKLLQAIQKKQSGYINEVIVVDGGSTDGTPKVAREFGAKVIASEIKGRAVQMNVGARAAISDILYFLHADSVPPYNFDSDVMHSLQKGYGAGSFRLCFDEDHFGLKFYAWFTRFNTNLIRFGDQSLFIKANLFRKIGDFDESLIVMEDQEIYHRIKQKSSVDVIQKNVTTSARKYRKNGVFRLQFIFTVLFVGYYMGANQETLVHLYHQLIRTG